MGWRRESSWLTLAREIASAMSLLSLLSLVHTLMVSRVYIYEVKDSLKTFKGHTLLIPSYNCIDKRLAANWYCSELIFISRAALCIA